MNRQKKEQHLSLQSFAAEQLFQSKKKLLLCIVMLQPCCINKYYPHTESARHEIEEEVNMIAICIHEMSKKPKPKYSNKELERVEAEQKGMDESFGSRPVDK